MKKRLILWTLCAFSSAALAVPVTGTPKDMRLLANPASDFAMGTMSEINVQDLKYRGDGKYEYKNATPITVTIGSQVYETYGFSQITLRSLGDEVNLKGKEIFFYQLSLVNQADHSIQIRMTINGARDPNAPQSIRMCFIGNPENCVLGSVSSFYQN